MRPLYYDIIAGFQQFVSDFELVNWIRRFEILCQITVSEKAPRNNFGCKPNTASAFSYVFSIEINHLNLFTLITCEPEHNQSG